MRCRVPSPTVAQMSDAVARCLIRRADGEPLDSPETWRAVAASLDVRIHDFHVPGGCPGAYHSLPPGDPPAGIVELNVSYSRRRQSQILVHELAHHYLHAWQPPLLDDFSDSYRYDDDPRCVQHRIARRVERLVLR